MTVIITEKQKRQAARIRQLEQQAIADRMAILLTRLSQAEQQQADRQRPGSEPLSDSKPTG